MLFMELAVELLRNFNMLTDAQRQAGSYSSAFIISLYSESKQLPEDAEMSTSISVYIENSVAN